MMVSNYLDLSPSLDAALYCIVCFLLIESSSLNWSFQQTLLQQLLYLLFFVQD